MQATTVEPVTLFFSYSHKDAALRAELDVHLSLLKRQGLLSTWFDGQIRAGDEWCKEIERNLEISCVILLLISADFLASDFCWGVELRRAMERHESGTARVIPIILRPCDWQAAPFGKLQALPANGLPVTQWRTPDEAWLSIAQGLRHALSESSHTNRVPREKWILTIDAELDCLGRDQLVIITDLLRELSGDARLSITKATRGSVKLELNISREGAERLQLALKALQPMTLATFKVLGLVSQDSLTSDPATELLPPQDDLPVVRFNNSLLAAGGLYQIGWLYTSRAFPSPTMIGVPHRNSFFTGREDLLSRLHQQLQTQGISALAQAAVHGLGGIGKTQTAIEYAYRFGEHYRFILWGVATDDTAIQSTYLYIARELGLVEAQGDLETAVRAVKTWLSREAGWLLIFDNADDPALVRRYLPPTRADGKVLLTSRAKSFVKVGIKKPFRVKTLEPQEAVKFLTERTGKAATQGATELAAELGYLPLALEQAAAYIETVGGSFAEYLARYRRQGITLFAKGEPNTDYPKTVMTVWTLSFDAVRETFPASAELLIAAAFLVPDSIPIEIFTRGSSELGEPLAQALKSADEESLVFWELFEPLERYSLVDRLPDDSFNLHRLTQEVVKLALGEEGQRAWAERVVRALNAAYPEAEFDNWKLCERLQPSARQASELVHKYKLESAEASKLFNSAGEFAQARGDRADAKLLNGLSLEISFRVFGGEHPNTLRAGNNLAWTLRSLNDLTGARTLLEQILAIQEHLLGSEHADTLFSRNNLGETLRALGDLAAARKLHEQDLETWVRMLGAEHPDTLPSRNNLAETLRDLGDLAAARKLHEQNLEIRERVLGAEHPNSLTSRHNLATTLGDLGDLAAARKLHEQNLEICERVLGDKHPNTLISKSSLGAILYRLGDFAQSRIFQEQAQEIRKQVLGAEHPDTTISTWNLLMVVRMLNDTDAEAFLLGNLRWLLDHDEDSIPSADQRFIRRKLLDLLNPP